MAAPVIYTRAPRTSHQERSAKTGRYEPTGTARKHPETVLFPARSVVEAVNECAPRSWTRTTVSIRCTR